jgi:hypothetical protein
MSLLSVIYAECHNLPHYAECRYAECHYAECRYAKCRGARKIVDQSNKTFYKSDYSFYNKRFVDTIRSGANVINLFSAVSYEFL